MNTTHILQYDNDGLSRDERVIENLAVVASEGRATAIADELNKWIVARRAETPPEPEREQSDADFIARHDAHARFADALMPPFADVPTIYDAARQAVLTKQGHISFAPATVIT